MYIFYSQLFKQNFANSKNVRIFVAEFKKDAPVHYGM
jgi:hypothetical protein